MPIPKQVIAVFDIGKTNKKFFLFDQNYSVIEKHQTEIKQTLDDDGHPCEGLEELEFWVRDHFNRAKKNYEISALNFSAYGASFVHIGHHGRPVTPLYNYLNRYPEHLSTQFYEKTGSRESFSLETASPPMGMLNSGLQLYWLKYAKPELFSKIETSLHLPNYLSYLFSGKKVSELTSIGCHTALWDFEKADYHQWVYDEELARLLPAPQPAYNSFHQIDNNHPQSVKYSSLQADHNSVKAVERMKIGPGIHDSSAALTPYLLGMDEPFILISTGTWSISLNPFNSKPLTYREMEKDCLCYMDIHGNQVKASRFFLGAEYAHQKKRIESFFGKTIDENSIKADATIFNQLVTRGPSDHRLSLEQAFGSGPFPQPNRGDWKLDRFSSPTEAYHQLVLDLVSIQAESIRLALGSMTIEKFIITGGFSKNDFFVSLLASFFPDKKLYTSRLPGASALGAALVLDETLVSGQGIEPSLAEHTESGKGIRTFTTLRTRNEILHLLSLTRVEPVKGLQLNHYSWNDKSVE